MARQRAAAFVAEARHDIDHALRKAGLVHEPREFQQRRGTVFGSLEHHGAAGRECRPHLHGRQEQLRIPRHDGGDDTHRLPSQRHFHIGLVDG
jgi:ParB family chromosome partitioning protein